MIMGGVTIPLEIFPFILNHYFQGGKSSFNNVRGWRFVCKNWQSVIDSYYYKSALDITYHTRVLGPLTVANQKYLFTTCKNVLNLYLEMDWDNNFVLHSTITNLTNLCKLELHNIYISSEILSHLTLLTSLKIVSPQAKYYLFPLLSRLEKLNLHIEGIDIKHFSSLISLTNITVKGRGGMNMSSITGLTNLSKVNFSGSVDVNVGDLAYVTSLSKLQSLSLPNLWLHRDDQLSFLKDLTMLTYLDGGYQLNNNNIAYISNIYNLRTLCLSNVTNMSFVCNLTCLTKLSINGDGNILNTNFISVLSSLRFISLHNTGITDKDMSILSLLKNLTYIDLSGNKEISKDVLNYVTKLPGLTFFDWQGTKINIGELTVLTVLTNLDKNLLEIIKDNIRD